MEYTPNTNYYIKLPVIKLQEILDDMLVDIIGYNPEREWKLEDVCRSLKYLADDEVAINIQISNPQWTEHKLKDGSVINARGVIGYIDEQDFALAEYYFQTDIFLTQSEYNNLIPTQLVN